MSENKGVRIKQLTFSVKKEVPWPLSYHRGEDGVANIAEMQDQFLIVFEDETYRGFVKENITAFELKTEEFELKTKGGIFLPDGTGEIINPMDKKKIKYAN